MPIEIVLSDALENHVADCPNVDALDARVTALEQGGGGAGVETDPIWTADQPYYDTSVAVTQKITNHNINESAHGYLVGKVATLQSVIPGTATPENQLITASNLQTGINSVYVPGAMVYRGMVASVEDLQNIVSPAAGDYYGVGGSFYIYNGTAWEEASGLTDLTDYYTKPEVDTLMSAESQALESEIKKILDDYASEHGNDKNEWISIFPSTGIAIGSGTFSLDVDLKEVGATEILVLFRMGSVALPQKTASCILPITSEFVPQANYTNYAGHGTTYNGGSVYYKGIITDNPSPGDADTGAAFASFHFPNYNTIQVAIGPFGYLTGVFYRRATPNAVIQYHKDPTIIVTGNQGTDWSNITGLSLNGTPYLPTTSDGTNVSTGEPYTMPKDGYLYVLLTFRNPRLVYTTVEMKINGTRISLWAGNNPNETTPDDYRSISAYARVNAGDQLTISVDYRYAGTIPWNGVYNNIYLYGLKDTEVVDDAVSEAFNQHTQNTDIHVTAAEKADFHAPEVSYTTETTLYEADVQIPHVQSPDGDLPIAPLAEVVLHAQNDQGYWKMLQMALNQITANQALATKLQQQINDLLTRVAVLENSPVPAPEPVYDMTSALTLHTPALLGLLGIEIGSVDLIGTGWTAPGDGLIVIDGASTIGLLTPTWIAVNGVKADPSGAVVLTLLGSDGSSGEIEISEGDVVTQSGMGNITFYKRIN